MSRKLRGIFNEKGGRLLMKIKLLTICSFVAILATTPVFAQAKGKDTAADPRSKVVIVRDKTVFDEYGNVKKDVLQKMLDRAITEFFGVDTPQEGWKKIFSPKDKVAIKVNGLSAWYAFNNSPYKAVTHPEFADAVALGIESAGVKPKNIVMYDRATMWFADKSPTDILGKSGYYKLVGSSSKAKVSEGGKYGPVETLSNGLKVNFFEFLHDADKIVNMPVLKGHHIMGFTFALKNHFGSFKNADTKLTKGLLPSSHAQDLHENAGVPGVAALESNPILKDKNAVIIGDILRAQYRTAFYDPEGSWAYNGIVIGSDPVAVDAVAWDIVQKKRKETNIDYFISVSLDQWYMMSPKERDKRKIYPNKMRYGGKAGEYLYDCGRKGLGESNLEKIDLKIIDL